VPDLLRQYHHIFRIEFDLHVRGGLKMGGAATTRTALIVHQKHVLAGLAKKSGSESSCRSSDSAVGKVHRQERFSICSGEC